MPTYQLRLPVSHGLERWLDEVCWGVLEALVRRTALGPWGPHAFVRIREILREVLERTVTTYRSCGLWSYCRAGTRPSPWMPQEAYQPEEAGVRWYLLEAPEGLEGLVAESTNRIGEFLACFLRESSPRSVIEAAVEAALRRGVGRYLYENSHCGTHPFCAERVPLNPWQSAPITGAGSHGIEATDTNRSIVSARPLGR